MGQRHKAELEAQGAAIPPLDGNARWWYSEQGIDPITGIGPP